jgi:hypothetical protein
MAGQLGPLLASYISLVRDKAAPELWRGNWGRFWEKADNPDTRLITPQTA